MIFSSLRLTLLSINRIFWVLSALICIGASSPIANAQVYTWDAHSLQEYRGDPRTLHVEEWQVWMYKRGQKTGGPDHWGIISAKTADAVMKQLKNAQDFEQRYCKFFGHPPNCEQNMTYFNSLGPIAKTSSAHQGFIHPFKDSQDAVKIITLDRKLPHLIDAMESLNETREKLTQLMELYTAVEKPYNPYSHAADAGRNPFSGIGTSAMEYGQSLINAIESLKKATEKTYSLANVTLEDTMLLSENDNANDRAISNLARQQAANVSALPKLANEQAASVSALPKPSNQTDDATNASWLHFVSDGRVPGTDEGSTIDVALRSDRQPGCINRYLLDPVETHQNENVSWLVEETARKRFVWLRWGA